MNWLLIVVLGIILVTGVVGYYKGLIKTILSMATIILSAVLTSMIAPKVSEILCENESVYGSVYDVLSENLDLSDVTATLAAQTGEKLDEATQSEILDKVGIPPVVKEIVIDSGNLEKFASENAEKFESYLYNLLANLIINAASYVLVFIAISIILAVVASVLNIISKLPGLKSLNRMAGAMIGVVEGFVIVWIFFILVSVLPGNEFMEKCNSNIEESSVLTYLYDNNIIMNVVADYVEEVEGEYIQEIMKEFENGVTESLEEGAENLDK